jgi:hypothetical protein
MYISINNHPLPEFATIDKTFIPEPILPNNDDETLAALIPCSHGSMVMTAVSPDQVEDILEFAQRQEVSEQDIDWVIVDTETMDNLIIAHLRKHVDDFVELIKKAILN